MLPSAIWRGPNGYLAAPASVEPSAPLPGGTSMVCSGFKSVARLPCRHDLVALDLQEADHLLRATNIGSVMF